MRQRNGMAAAALLTLASAACAFDCAGVQARVRARLDHLKKANEALTAFQNAKLEENQLTKEKDAIAKLTTGVMPVRAVGAPVVQVIDVEAFKTATAAAEQARSAVDQQFTAIRAAVVDVMADLDEAGRGALQNELAPVAKELEDEAKEDKAVAAQNPPGPEVQKTMEGLNTRRTNLLLVIKGLSETAMATGNDGLLKYLREDKDARGCQDQTNTWLDREENKNYREHLGSLEGKGAVERMVRLVKGKDNDEAATQRETSARAFLGGKTDGSKSQVTNGGSRITIQRGATIWGIARQMAGLDNSKKNWKRISDIVAVLQKKLKRESSGGKVRGIDDPRRGNVGDYIDLSDEA
jgi:hypothetical protein